MVNELDSWLEQFLTELWIIRVTNCSREHEFNSWLPPDRTLVYQGSFPLEPGGLTQKLNQDTRPRNFLKFYWIKIIFNLNIYVFIVYYFEFVCADIKSGHAFVVGEEGYRQDSDFQKAKFSREALTQLSKLVESRVCAGYVSLFAVVLWQLILPRFAVKCGWCTTIVVFLWFQKRQKALCRGLDHGFGPFI